MKNLRKRLLAALAFTAFASGAQAQPVDGKVLTLQDAKRMTAAAAAEARKNNTGGAIAVTDAGGHVIYLERLDGTFPAGASVSVGKARTAATFKKPTRVFEEAIKNGRTALTAVPEMTPLQGGVPVVFEGQVIGGVGVSGASSQQQDEEYALAAANALTASAAQAAPAPTAYFPAAQVAESFSKGAVLLNRGDYQVHTSRRVAAGKAEVHTLDTDIFYVMEGSAVLVTGGTLVEGKTVEPNEIRGASIQGGETRKIAKGDTLVIPNGTPHWFKEVSGPVTYLAIKVRSNPE